MEVIDLAWKGISKSSIEKKEFCVKIPNWLESRPANGDQAGQPTSPHPFYTFNAPSFADNGASHCWIALAIGFTSSPSSPTFSSSF